MFKMLSVLNLWLPALLLLLLSLVVEALNITDNLIMKKMATQFLSADNDFVHSQPNENFFPFSKTMEFNR